MYSDADWANDLEDRKSAFVFGNPVSWTTRKQPLVDTSSFEAEYIALSETIKEVIWMKSIMKDFKIIIQEPIYIWKDNHSVIALTKLNQVNKRSKHVEI
ncbi:hypothetical protein JTB14_016993 [Gonioctena quinquepunctata]|nr:hypothetical protein JTB14_016993 [Gonioctena quinquepunctata]